MYSDTLSQREIASLRLDCLREASTNTFASEDTITEARLRRAKAFADFVLEVHSCECCQPRPSTELARLRRVNRRLLANRKQLIEELKLAYRQLAEVKRELEHYERHCYCLSRHPRGQRSVVLLWDSVRRDCEARRAAVKEVAQ